jgi:hypothetical protein
LQRHCRIIHAEKERSRMVGIIEKIFGQKTLSSNSGTAFKTVSECETALATVATERRVAEETIRELASRRREILLTDGGESTLAEIDRAGDEARITLERADLIEPIIMGRMVEISDENRRAKWRDLSERHIETTRKFIETVRAAVAARAAMDAVLAEACKSGFMSQAQAAFCAPLNSLNAEALANFVEVFEKSHVPACRAALKN